MLRAVLLHPMKEQLHLGTLLTGITTPVSFQNVVESLRRRAPDHAPIEEEVSLALPRVELSTLSEWVDKEALGKESLFLYELSRQGGRISYASEKDIQRHAVNLLSDLLRLMGCDEDGEIVRSLFLGRDSSDIFYLQTRGDGVPLMVIAVKPPRKANGKDFWDCPTMLGQLFDYMYELRHMYGLNEVFGILTYLKGWKICCLPDNLDFATSLSVDSSSSSIPFSSCASPSSLPVRRALALSKKIDVNDPDLSRWLVLYVKKCLHATFRSLPPLSNSRCLLTFTYDSYYWKEKPITNVNISPPQNNITTESFTIIRYFRGGADGNVALAITDRGNLAVLKFHHDVSSDMREKETALWESVYGISCPIVPLDGGRLWAMVMPLVFHATENNGNVSFNFNLADWCKCAEFVSSESCPLLDEWTSKLTHAWRYQGMSVEQVAQDAMSSIARAGYVHRDVKWNHIALLPVIEESGDVVTLKSVMIDFASVEECTDEETAMTQMSNQLLTNNHECL